jgi:hypothetical protein
VFYFVCLCIADRIINFKHTYTILLNIVDIEINGVEKMEHVGKSCMTFIENCDNFLSLLKQTDGITVLLSNDIRQEFDTLFILRGVGEFIVTLVTNQSKSKNIIAQGDDIINVLNAKGKNIEVPSNVRFGFKEGAGYDMALTNYMQFITNCVNKNHKFYSFPLSREQRPFTIAKLDGVITHKAGELNIVDSLTGIMETLVKNNLIELVELLLPSTSSPIAKYAVVYPKYGSFMVDLLCVMTIPLPGAPHIRKIKRVLRLE